MKRPRARKLVLGAIAAVLLLGGYAWYARPVTILELYPMLSLDQCTRIRGYYKIGAQPELSEFTIEQGSAEFEQLCQLFYERDYRRSLKDLLPRGTRVHRTEPDEFRWEVYFVFEDVEFPDGSTGSGDMLQFVNWYGELDIRFNGETHLYQTSEQENWCAQVLEIIQ